MKKKILMKRSGGALRIWSIWTLFALLMLFSPTTLQAVSLSGTSSTYLQARESAGDKQFLPLYEYVNLSVYDIGKEARSFHMGGWIRYDIAEESLSDKKMNSDLQYAYASCRFDKDNAMVSLGRVPVFEGTITEKVDGVYARTDVRAGFGVSAFGGSPVEFRVNKPGNNVIYGGRISHRFADMTHVGVSYMREEKDSDDFRKEAGVDLWARPVDFAEIMGRSSYNSLTEGWMEHAYFLSLGPFAKLRLNTEASWINYEDYFSATLNPVFKFNPLLIDPKETLSVIGEEVSYPITDKLTASVDYKKYTYDIAGSAGSLGGRVAYSEKGAWGAGASLRRTAGETDKLKYTEYRVYYFRKMGKIDLTADIFDVRYDEEISGVKDALTIAAAGGYELTEALKLGADLEYSQNPDFDNDVRAFVKCIYRFNAGAEKKGGM